MELELTTTLCSCGYYNHSIQEARDDHSKPGTALHYAQKKALRQNFRWIPKVGDMTVMCQCEFFCTWWRILVFAQWVPWATRVQYITQGKTMLTHFYIRTVQCVPKKDHSSHRTVNYAVSTRQTTCCSNTHTGVAALASWHRGGHLPGHAVTNTLFRYFNPVDISSTSNVFPSDS